MPAAVNENLNISFDDTSDTAVWSVINFGTFESLAHLHNKFYGTDIAFVIRRVSVIIL